MGGYGSGRPSTKQKAEDCKSLDVNQMHRAGSLEPGRSGNWIWSRDGREFGRIDYTTEAHRLILHYRVRFNRGDWESIKQHVSLTYAECNYGSERPYFLCPGVINGRHCGRRVGKLFSGGKYFLCRHCYNVAYSSQSEERSDRMLRRANKIRRALGGEPGTAQWIARKPKGMHQRTYQRKVDEINSCEGVANIMFLRKYSRFLSPEELEMYFD